MRGTVLAVVLVMALPAYAQRDRVVTTLGPGAGISCGQWLQSRNSRRDNPMTVWALGFLSAVATYHGRNILDDLDVAGIQQWLDNYCRSNPLERFATALRALADGRLRVTGR